MSRKVDRQVDRQLSRQVAMHVARGVCSLRSVLTGRQIGRWSVRLACRKVGTHMAMQVDRLVHLDIVTTPT